MLTELLRKLHTVSDGKGERRGRVMCQGSIGYEEVSPSGRRRKEYRICLSYNSMIGIFPATHMPWNVFLILRDSTRPVIWAALDPTGRYLSWVGRLKMVSINYLSIGLESHSPRFEYHSDPLSWLET
jgi:hypothetical protein